MTYKFYSFIEANKLCAYQHNKLVKHRYKRQPIKLRSMEEGCVVARVFRQAFLF